jgi:hypothetical protein
MSTLLVDMLRLALGLPGFGGVGSAMARASWASNARFIITARNTTRQPQATP